MNGRHRYRSRAAAALLLAGSAVLVAFPPHLVATHAQGHFAARVRDQAPPPKPRQVKARARNNLVCVINFNPVIKLNNQQNQRQINTQAITQTIALSNTNQIKQKVIVVTKVVTKIVPVEVVKVVKVPVYIQKVIYPIQTPYPTPTPYAQAAYPTPTDTPMPYQPPAYP